MKKCRICQVRPIGGGNPGNGPGAETAEYARHIELCRPCATEAGWENTHSDEGHDDAEFPVRDSLTENCWECHPELNRASAEYVSRTGTSRAGMRVTVPIRAAGEVKANAVADLLKDRFACGIVKPTKRNGYVTRVTLTHAGDFSLDLHWDASGRFIYGPSTANGKRVRNVSAALRALGF